MSSRILIVLNAVGCLLLAGIVVTQWVRERGLGQQLEQVAAQLADARQEVDDERARVVELEQDIALLKDSLGAAKSAVAERDEALAQRVAEIEVLNGRVAEGNRQLEQWDAAVKARDEVVGKLQTELQTARLRLEEAIAKLKAVSKEAAR